MGQRGAILHSTQNFVKETERGRKKINDGKEEEREGGREGKKPPSTMVLFS